MPVDDSTMSMRVFRDEIARHVIEEAQRLHGDAISFHFDSTIQRIDLEKQTVSVAMDALRSPDQVPLHSQDLHFLHHTSALHLSLLNKKHHYPVMQALPWLNALITICTSCSKPLSTLAYCLHRWRMICWLGLMGQQAVSEQHCSRLCLKALYADIGIRKCTQQPLHMCPLLPSYHCIPSMKLTHTRLVAAQAALVQGIALLNFACICNRISITKACMTDGRPSQSFAPSKQKCIYSSPSDSYRFPLHAWGRPSRP